MYWLYTVLHWFFGFNILKPIRKPNSKPFLIGTWYRPPNSTVDKFDLFESLIGRLDAENVEYYLLGDFNCNVKASEPDHSTRVLKGVTDLYGLEQLINEPNSHH